MSGKERRESCENFLFCSCFTPTSELLTLFSHLFWVCLFEQVRSKSFLLESWRLSLTDLNVQRFSHRHLNFDSPSSWLTSHIHPFGKARQSMQRSHRFSNVDVDAFMHYAAPSLSAHQFICPEYEEHWRVQKKCLKRQSRWDISSGKWPHKELNFTMAQKSLRA